MAHVGQLRGRAYEPGPDRKPASDHLTVGNPECDIDGDGHRNGAGNADSEWGRHPPERDTQSEDVAEKHSYRCPIRDCVAINKVALGGWDGQP